MPEFLHAASPPPAEWDGWQAHAFALVDELVAEEPPFEVKSLPALNPVTLCQPLPDGNLPPPHPLFPKRRRSMAENLRAGTKVSWKSHAGEAHGKVIGKLTGPTRIKSHKVAASPENPEYLVETEEGKRAAHKPEALRKD